MRELKHNITLLFIDFTFIFKKLPEAFFFVKFFFKAVKFFFFFFFFFLNFFFMRLNFFFFFFFFFKKAPKYVSEHQTDDYLPGYTIACSLSRAFSVLEN